MADFIKSQWHAPVEMCSGKVKALMSALHTATHSYTQLQGREEGAFTLLQNLLQVLPDPDPEYNGKLLHIAGIFTFQEMYLVY